MLRFGLIGETLGHSASVPIHRALYRLLGVEADYALYPLPRASFRGGAAALLAELDGFNVTIPYKRDIMPLLDGLTPAAEAIGAVNTVLRRGDRRIGDNTDAEGFAAMLRLHGLDPAGQPCYILGTGGASAACAAALRGLGAASVTLVSRRPAGGAIGYEALAETGCGLLVNATPAGMLGQADRCPLTERQLRALLPRLTGVADVVYNPPRTPLTLAAQAAGVPACTGGAMLVAQAVAAERRWLGLPIPDDVIPALLEEVHLT